MLKQELWSKAQLQLSHFVVQAFKRACSHDRHQNLSKRERSRAVAISDSLQDCAATTATDAGCLAIQKGPNQRLALTCSQHQLRCAPTVWQHRFIQSFAPEFALACLNNRSGEAATWACGHASLSAGLHEFAMAAFLSKDPPLSSAKGLKNVPWSFSGPMSMSLALFPKPCLHASLGVS